MNHSIMIVDDMRSNIYMLADILKNKYRIIPATSGEDAIKLLDRTKPDLVLLDVSMPGIDGFGVLNYIKTHEALMNIPVIFVTGEHDTLTEERGLSLGAVDYIKKPFIAAIVNVKVRNHIELKSYRDSLEIMVRQRTEQLEKRTEELEERTIQLAASREAIIMGMSLMSESHDKVTGQHIERMKKFAGVLANKLLMMRPDMITPDLARQIELYSPLHDVGKVSVSDSILKKTALLTSEEFDIMKMHTVDGAKLLRETELYLADGNDSGDLRVAIEIAESHHEKYDGSGYPNGLKGDEIPLSARIVSLADVYDALRSSRPYKKVFSHQEAMKIITEGDGRTDCRHFDPRVLTAFIAIQGEFEKIFSYSDIDT